MAVIVLGAAACAPVGEEASAPSDPVPSGATRPLDLTDPDRTPPVDTDIAAVPLEEIVFDTFDGGSVGLDEIDEATIDRLFDAIAPLDAPDYDAAASVDWLADDDLVIGYLDDGGGAWAFPTRILDGHEIVNDELAGRPLLVSWCPLCGSGVVYDRRLAGERRSFSNTSALHDSDLVMVDRETGTYWWQVAGRALVGLDVGAELEAVPSVTTSWGRWRDDHPGTAVLRRPPGREYGPSRFVGYAERVDAGDTPFPVGERALGDDRLPASTAVVAVEDVSGFVAWPTAPARRFEADLDRGPVTVVTDGVGGSVTDTATAETVPTRRSMWFAVVAAFPDVQVGDER